MKNIVRFMIVPLFIIFLVSCNQVQSKEEIDKIVFADARWDSIQVHNHIAQTIIEAGFDYDTEVTTGSTAATIQGLREGDINVYMEIWKENIRELYEKALDAEDIVTVSTNFADNEQGLFVPTYVIEGDPERGIEPMAPDLRTVEDLKNYADVFVDPEDPNKGRIINGPVGWEVDDVITEKIKTYGLEDTMNDFIPGSDSAAIADLVSAYEAGEPWVGYYWSPTWITAKYDLTLLQEPEYDEETWLENKGTAFPPNEVEIAVQKDLLTQAPEVVEFLEKYETSSELTEAALNYMEETDSTTEEAAIWWMNEYEEVWTDWVSEETVEKVKEVL